MSEGAPRHQSSRRSKGDETARRSRQWVAYAAATEGEATRFRSSEFRAAPAVQLYEPIKVMAPSMTMVLTWAILARRSIHTSTPALIKGSIPLLRAQGVVLS